MMLDDGAATRCSSAAGARHRRGHAAGRRAGGHAALGTDGPDGDSPRTAASSWPGSRSAALTTTRSTAARARARSRPRYAGRGRDGHLVHRPRGDERHGLLLRRPRGERGHRVDELAALSRRPRWRDRARAATRSCSRTATRGRPTWKLGFTPTVARGGIEGFATAQSINHGESVGLKVNTAAGASYSAYVYRSGYYGGAGARLYSVLTGLVGTAQPACTSAPTTTGPHRLLQLVGLGRRSRRRPIGRRASTSSGSCARTTAPRTTSCSSSATTPRTSDLLYGLPFTTYEAYNGYGGKSLYPFNSTGANTVAGNPEAVKVSFDRPFDYARIGGTHDWYTRSDYPLVYWLERSGYDVVVPVRTRTWSCNGARVKNHRAYMLGRARRVLLGGDAHRARAGARRRRLASSTPARTRSTGRSASRTGPVGGQNRVLVCYKTTADRRRRTRAGSRPAPGATRPGRTSRRTRCSA